MDLIVSVPEFTYLLYTIFEGLFGNLKYRKLVTLSSIRFVNKKHGLRA